MYLVSDRSTAMKARNGIANMGNNYFGSESTCPKLSPDSKWDRRLHGNLHLGSKQNKPSVRNLSPDITDNRTLPVLRLSRLGMLWSERNTDFQGERSKHKILSHLSSERCMNSLLGLPKVVGESLTIPSGVDAEALAQSNGVKNDSATNLALAFKKSFISEISLSTSSMN